VCVCACALNKCSYKACSYKVGTLIFVRGRHFHSFTVFLVFSQLQTEEDKLKANLQKLEEREASVLQATKQERGGKEQTVSDRKNGVLAVYMTRIQVA